MKQTLKTPLLCLIVLFVATLLTNVSASPMPGKPKIPKLTTIYVVTGTATDGGVDPLYPSNHLYTVSAKFGSANSTAPYGFTQIDAPTDISITVVSNAYCCPLTYIIPSGNSYVSYVYSLPTALGWKITDVSPTSIGGVGVYLDNTQHNGTSTYYSNYTPPAGW